MKQFVGTVFCGLTVFAAGMALTSCGGGGNDGGDARSVGTEGYAPLTLKEDLVLVPVSGEQVGKITLHADSAHTCDFAVQDAENWLFRGVYTYQKWDANMARIRMEHLDLDGIISPGDLTFTIDGYLKFFDAETVQFSGTETLGGHGVGVTEDGEASSNDPFSFAVYIYKKLIDEDGKVTEGDRVADGGSKTFTYIYKVVKE